MAHIPRPVLAASRPSHTMATMGPLFMSTACQGSGRNWWGAAMPTLNESGEEGLILEVLVVLLEVRLAGRGHLQGDQLVPALVSPVNTAAADGATDPLFSKREMMSPTRPRCKLLAKRPVQL